MQTLKDLLPPVVSYKDLVAQRQVLDQQIAAAREQEFSGAISKAREIVAEYELTQDDVFGTAKGVKAARKSSGKVAAKYRNPQTGDTWTGRGKAPRWVVGDKTQYLI